MKSVVLKEKGLTAYELKLLAIFAMTLDHIAYVYALPLGSAAVIMRMVGRATFPIMAFLITEGYVYSKNRYRYCIRLLLAALISTVPYYLVFGTPRNVLFTLAAGLLVLMVQDEVQKRRPEIPALVWQLFFACIAVGAAGLMQSFDWGLPGIVAIYLVGQFKKKPYFLQGIVCTGSLLMITILRRLLTGGGFTPAYCIFLAGLPLAAIWIGLYNGKRGRDMRYFFYAYYPVHLLLLYGIMQITH